MITNGGTYTTKTSVSSNTYCCLTKIWCSARGSNTYNCWFYPTIRCQVIIKQRGAPKVKCCTYAKERTYPTGTTVPLCEFEMIIPSLSIKHFHKVACLWRIFFCYAKIFVSLHVSATETVSEVTYLSTKMLSADQEQLIKAIFLQRGVEDSITRTKIERQLKGYVRGRSWQGVDQ